MIYGQGFDPFPANHLPLGLHGGLIHLNGRFSGRANPWANHGRLNHLNGWFSGQANPWANQGSAFATNWISKEKAPPYHPKPGSHSRLSGKSTHKADEKKLL